MNGDYAINVVATRRALLSNATKRRTSELESLHDRILEEGR